MYIPQYWPVPSLQTCHNPFGKQFHLFLLKANCPLNPKYHGIPYFGALLTRHLSFLNHINQSIIDMLINPFINILQEDEDIGKTKEKTAEVKILQHSTDQIFSFFSFSFLRLEFCLSLIFLYYRNRRGLLFARNSYALAAFAGKHFEPF